MPDQHFSTSGTPLDEALRTLSAFSPAYHGEFTNHAPMVVETLDRLGHSDLIACWVDDYVGRLEPAPVASGSEIRLGDGDFAGWRAHYAAAIAASSPADVLTRALPQLCGGVAAAAGHGLLRTYHATLALERAHTPERSEELAAALGYWAASHLELGGAEPAGPGDPAEVLRELPPAPPASGSITARLGTLDPALFAHHTGRASFPDDPREALAHIVALAFSVLRQGPGTTGLLHATTTARAALHLCDYTDKVTAQRLATQSWWLLVALHHLYPPADAAPPQDPAQLGAQVRAAVASGDEHRVKFAGCATESPFVDDLVRRQALSALR